MKRCVVSFAAGALIVFGGQVIARAMREAVEAYEKEMATHASWPPDPGVAEQPEWPTIFGTASQGMGHQMKVPGQSDLWWSYPGKGSVPVRHTASNQT